MALERDDSSSSTRSITSQSTSPLFAQSARTQERIKEPLLARKGTVGSVAGDAGVVAGDAEVVALRLELARGNLATAVGTAA